MLCSRGRGCRAATLALALLAVSGDARAEPSEPAPSEASADALIQEGEEANARGEYAAAGASFSAAYATLTAAERVGPEGVRIIGSALAAYDSAHRQDGDVAHLEAARRLLLDRRAYVKAAGGTFEPEFMTALEDLDVRIEVATKLPAPDAAPPAEDTAPAPVPAQEHAPVPLLLDPPPADPKPKPAARFPRVFVGLGLGFGFGMARGPAELTYQEYQPGLPGSIYGVREQACAVERWYAGGDGLAADQITFSRHVDAVAAADPAILPFDPADPDQAADFIASYDPASCGRRHGISRRTALAPLHLAPEIGVRVGRALVISIFSRLQVVTGSNVETNDTDLPLQQSFDTDVRSPRPPGFRQKPPFSWSIGAKVKYFFRQDHHKLRPFAGGFIGYGFARLRVPLGISNDRNGNSVPDERETALHGPIDAMGNVDPTRCIAVWPYNLGCEQTFEGDSDRMIPVSVRSATSEADERIDTVVLGPGFIGLAGGIHVQLVRYFALFAELDLGIWFPATTSVLFDLTVGPVLTF